MRHATSAERGIPVHVRGCAARAIKAEDHTHDHKAAWRIRLAERKSKPWRHLA